MFINKNFISPHLISYITTDNEMYEIKFSMTFARDCRMKTVLEYTIKLTVQLIRVSNTMFIKICKFLLFKN